MGNDPEIRKYNRMTCLYLENGFPPKCNHPRVQNDDELFPNRRENLVKYVCLGKPEFCVFKVREEWLKNEK